MRHIKHHGYVNGFLMMNVSYLLLTNGHRLRMGITNGGNTFMMNIMTVLSVQNTKYYIMQLPTGKAIANIKVGAISVKNAQHEQSVRKTPNVRKQ